jgi:competence protein ComEA
LPAVSALERVRDLRGDPRVRITALLVAALVAGLVWYQLGARGSARAGAGARATPPTSAAAGERASGADDVTGASTTSEPSGTVVVHVAGAVVHPGVVSLHAGARVVDAIQAAGGGAAGADLDRLNLAAKVVDGQRIAVAVVGAPTPPAVDGPTPDGGTGGGGSTATGPVNLNTATQSQLEELPGIGPSLAAAIIAEREKRGGFKAVGDLQDVRGIGEMRFAEIKDLVSV